MTRFIVHIGDGKCGSSSIQASLFDRAAQLEETGIVYVSEHRTGGQFGFVTLLGKATRSDNTRLLNSAQSVVKTIRGKLRKADFVLLSAESFFSLPPEDVQSLLERITPDITSIDIISYVRPSEQMYLSLVQQRLKGSHTFATPPNYKRNLHSSLERWLDHPKTNSVTVRVFDRNRLVGNSVVTDFEDIVERLTGKTLGLQDTSTNNSLTAEQMIVLQQFRARVLRDQNGQLVPESNRLIHFFETLTALGPIGHKPQLKDIARISVLQNTQNTVERLNTLFPDLAMDTPDKTGVPGVEQDFDTSDVRTILQTYDEDLVKAISDLIPQFRPNLAHNIIRPTGKALSAVSLASPASPEDILNVVSKYWRAERAAVLETSP